MGPHPANNSGAAAYESGWTDLGEALLPLLTRHRDLWAHWVSFCAGPLELDEAATTVHEGLDTARSMGLEPMGAHLEDVLTRL